MNSYLVLIRGINVGGKNKVSMQELRQRLEETGYTNVSTYINSGNVVLASLKNASDVKKEIENRLPRWFKLDSELIKVHVISDGELSLVVKNKPHGFGDEPSKYHSDVIFLIGIDTDDAFKVFTPREDVDQVWKGDSVIYSQRLSAELTKSRLSKIMASPFYKSMTIRTWNTVCKLDDLMKEN